MISQIILLEGISKPMGKYLQTIKLLKSFPEINMYIQREFVKLLKDLPSLGEEEIEERQKEILEKIEEILKYFTDKIKSMRKILEKPHYGEPFTLEDLEEIKEFIKSPAYAFQKEISEEEIEEALKRDIEIMTKMLVEPYEQEVAKASEEEKVFKKAMLALQRGWVSSITERIRRGNLETYISAAASLLMGLEADRLFDRYWNDPNYKREDFARDSWNVIKKYAPFVTYEELERFKMELSRIYS